MKRLYFIKNTSLKDNNNAAVHFRVNFTLVLTYIIGKITKPQDS